MIIMQVQGALQTLLEVRTTVYMHYLKKYEHRTFTF